MVNIVGKPGERNDKIIETLSGKGFDIIVSTWKKIKKDPECCIILTPPETDLMYRKINSIINRNIPVILLSPDFKKEKVNIEKVVILPEDFPAANLPPLIILILMFNKAVTDILGLFFEGTGVELIAINKDNKIGTVITTSKTCLGYTKENLVGKDIEELFNFSISDLNENNSSEQQIITVLNAYGKQRSVIINKIPFSGLKIPGIPQSTTDIILITEVNELKRLEEKSIRMSALQDNLVKQRSVELESANEVLQKQASELHNAMEKLEMHNRQILEELSLASELQKSLLPREFPDDIPLNFAHRYVPFLDIGGDFFDVIRLDATTIGIIITDVSGHGVASAFLTSMFKSSFNHFGPGEYSPAATLSRLNKEFSNTIRTEHYLTAFYMIIDTDTMRCTYCNAGHPKQLLFRETGEVIELTSMGFFVGMFEGTDYEDGTIDLLPGDKICFFTDGIMETADSEGNLFGRENIIRVIQEGALKSMDEISNDLFTEVIGFMGEAGLDDDITFLLVELMESL